MKVLVTGGAGFVGSHIVDFLIEKGYEAVIVDNLLTGKESNINPKATFHKVDITNSEEIENVFSKEKPEVVIHAAAQVMLRRSIEDPILDAKINILGTINVLESCRKNNVMKIIYTTTGGARYGEPKSLPVSESHQIKPSVPYGISKHSAEHYVEMYSNLYGIDYLIFGFGNVYGPRDDPSSKRIIPLFIKNILNGEQPLIFGDGKQTRDFVYVLDLAEFIVDSINNNPEHKLFNLASGTQKSMNEMFAILKKVSGYLGDAKHTEAIKGEVRDIVLDIQLAREELGWSPSTNFEQGIKNSFDWFKSNPEA